MDFIEAANYTKVNRSKVNFIVIHDEEFPEKPTAAEDVANFFHNQPKNPTSNSSVNNPPGRGGSSAHYVVDNNSVVQCVKDEHAAWDAPPNLTQPHIGIEHSGFASQSRDQWLDDYGKKMLLLSAKLVAKKCVKYNIPVRKINAADLKAGKRGICGHADVSAAFGMSSHSDPGEHFPWGWYIERVERAKNVYVQYLAQGKDGKTIAKSKVVRATNARAFLRFLKDNAEKLRKNLGVRIKKIRRF
jgi:N-acetyl-anhydromuramyl-L-alanine amidase AmpD